MKFQRFRKFIKTTSTNQTTPQYPYPSTVIRLQKEQASVPKDTETEQAPLGSNRVLKYFLL